MLPFLAPFIAYFAYRLLVQRGQRFLGDTPWYALTVTGLSLAVMAIVASVVLGGHGPGGTYIPPRFEDGKVVPHEVIPGSRPDAASDAPVPHNARTTSGE